ncbi:MAG: adenylyl-sulfate reductase subunit alpha [Bacillota bacterium]|nr:adenylyl-sulfate reductase subunit alpha [Bacillota bacterium]
MISQIEQKYLNTDILIIGGGAAGCMAAITAKDTAPDYQIIIMEKAQIERSGCLAAGINAINAYLNPGESPETFLDYVKKEAYGIIQDHLVLSMAREINEMAERLEDWGLPIEKDEQGKYKARGKRSIRIKGERIKPIIAAQVKKRNIKVLNRVVATDYLTYNGRVVGAVGFSIRENKFYVIQAKVVICATAGAAGIYSSNNPGFAPHRTWYPPFNTGAGLAMGLRAGAEMTSFEMRFVALRIKDTLAPTGTVAQGTKISQINGLGEKYLEKYQQLTTAERLKAGLLENEEGRGPCFFDTTQLSSEESNGLKEAYLHMSPTMILSWANREIEPNEAPLELTCSEPYLVGGHAMAGYWINGKRQTTLPGLYAVGEAAGGVPKKYVTGSMAEGKIAAIAAIAEIRALADTADDEISAALVKKLFEQTYNPLQYYNSQGFGCTPEELEEALQKVMDEYAGGIRENYKITEAKLIIASEKIAYLEDLVQSLMAKNLHQLMMCHEVRDRILIAKVLVEHLKYRKETRWPGYQERLDYPEQSSQWKKFINSSYSSEANPPIKMIERDIKGDF